MHLHISFETFAILTCVCTVRAVLVLFLLKLSLTSVEECYIFFRQLRYFDERNSSVKRSKLTIIMDDHVIYLVQK